MAQTLSGGPVDIAGIDDLVTCHWTLPNVDVGDNIILGLVWFVSGGGGTARISSITCTGESNLTVHAPTLHDQLANGSYWVAHQFASLANCTASGTKTITVTMTANCSSFSGFAMAVAGGATSSYYDAGANATGSSANPTASVTTTADNDLLVALQTNNGADPTAGSGYTLVSVSNSNLYDQGEYKLDAGAAGSKTVDFTLGSTTWMVTAAAFKAGAATATGYKRIMMMGVG